ADIIKKGTIKSSGVLKGRYPIDTITQNIEEAMSNADIILVVTPAFAHKSIARLIAPYLTQEQIILLNPGRTFGSAEFKNAIEKEIGKIPIFVAETQTLLFTSRQLNKNKVEILKIKDTVDFCAFPEKDTFFIYDTLQDVFPQLNPVEDYLEVSLRNIGMLLHPTLGLMNAGFMDIGKEFKFYKEGATFHVCEVLEQVQAEVNLIFKKLGMQHFNFCEWAKKSYGINAKCIHDAIQNIIPYQDISAPKELISRYFIEDVPTGLVPIASLAKFLGVKTPTIDSIIHLTSILCGTKFKDTGRNFSGLNLNDFISRRIKVHEFGIHDEELKKAHV
ncbi:MAG: NADP transhydrogenase subunit alpha, partial [Promethearchaeota archaeon]